MNKPLVMTPGPTYVHEDVRRAMQQEVGNPDVEESFFEFYRETCERLKELLKTKNDVIILSGEGILGLEAACASVIEPGDRVLCIDNGIFGNGFGDFVKMYGGEATYLKFDYRRAVDVNVVENFLKNDHNFKAATLVHCETPSGITNPIADICKMLKRYGILSIVDAVSSIGGEPLEADEWEIDVVLGGSQKCISAPPGLTFMSISRDAWNAILKRKTPIIGYYCNLAVWKSWYEDRWFPYTQPVSDIYALRAAVDRLLQDDLRIERHKNIADRVRAALADRGLELYPENGFSNTVTAFYVPDGATFTDIYNIMLSEHNILIAGSFGFLKDKVIRIGHMGENCYEDKILKTFAALDKTFEKLNIDLRNKLPGSR
ncbi:MAG TPA: aminotransferase class V-fold PLP-dependent enzyme [Hungateiclostridium thermocellum]|jgi:aspartate aminotransferase-like enzyme|uniref:Alanine--glyoxylate transaminase n=2 Tax=Acetivibrio thermocellus TaxID=1515 RepID=A3DC25_ACET2|nr:alanine--glyoxylate aminotransferase family protein [Acetivibrio thermocellus]ABN51504.1 Alanine--glyoxylate transaminase [Acetivibrio thermocellus ATCC 27405]ADU75011.1 Alanine--glyoxylate transaminase [Acetivibrio thermocellus DSM 1313]ALX08979.1 Alanine--glyoxylate transaminase [Acetivibrio thermocellus AD2]ANV76729.1 Alanine--glyoxylate transaminase [Acetivibrio thermocellus DSM 2360]EIC05060.1 aminotransferase class V [Acetivibrio thermocellus YS]